MWSDESSCLVQRVCEEKNEEFMDECVVGTVKHGVGYDEAGTYVGEND